MSTFLYKDFGIYNKGWDARKTAASGVLDDPDFIPVKSDYETEYSDDSVDIFGAINILNEDSEEFFEDWRSDSSFTAFTLVSESSLES